MSKVKDILGLAVRSITRRILGTNVPPMQKADGTLLNHLKRIKDGVRKAYVALESKGHIVTRPRNIDNLHNEIMELSLPFMKIDGEGVGTLSGLVLRDNSAVVEIEDALTDLDKLQKPWNNAFNTYFKSLFPSKPKIIFSKVTSITSSAGNSYGALIPKSTFSEATLNIQKLLNASAYSAIVINDTVITRLNLPLLETSYDIVGNYVTYQALASGCSALKTIYAPLYKGGETNGKALAIRQCNTLEEVYLPSLIYGVTYNWGMFDRLPALKKAILPQCKLLCGNGANKSMFENCPLLEEIVLGVLDKVTNYTSTNRLSTVALDNLYKLEVGSGSYRLPNLVNWTATNVDDSLLNENFKVFIAERLAPRPDGDTSTSLYTIQVSQSFYDRLTEENKTILTDKSWTIAIV